MAAACAGGERKTSSHGDGAPSAMLNRGVQLREVSKVRGVEAALTPELTGFGCLQGRREDWRRESRHQSGARRSRGEGEGAADMSYLLSSLVRDHVRTAVRMLVYVTSRPSSQWKPWSGLILAADREV